MIVENFTPAPRRQLQFPDFSCASAKPFLKWAGGKTQLLGQFEPLYPRQFSGYFEPFVGSAAVYFRLRSAEARERIDGKFTRIRLSDTNAELINCYKVIRDNLEVVLQLLAEHRKRHSSDHYYRVRGQSTGALSDTERAARFIYLNKTCYNGLYRVNRKGEFNVPIGSYKNPRIFDAAELSAASLALQDVEIEVDGFENIAHYAREGDFVYFDPPYHPISATASFTSYTEDGFGKAEQVKLFEIFKELDALGCLVMLSNSWTPFIRDLYKDFTCKRVHAGRAINSKAERRGKIPELVVLNYDPSDGES